MTTRPNVFPGARAGGNRDMSEPTRPVLRYHRGESRKT